jgi:hypothetical protein
MPPAIVPVTAMAVPQLTPAVLASVPEQQRKQMIGDYVYTQVEV